MDLPIIILDISLFLGLYFQIFLLVTFFESEEKKQGEQKTNLPSVSIIVPCFNEARTVEKTVLSLLGLDYPKEKLSILIVDDGSSDETYAVANAIVKKVTNGVYSHVSKSKRVSEGFKNIRVVKQKNGGKYTAMNYGIRQSTADIVGCLDADSTVDSQALIRMIPYFNDKKIVAVTPALRVAVDDARGSTVSKKHTTTLQHIQRTEYNVGIFTKYVYSKMDAIHVTPGPFSIFRRDIFDTIGYFRHAHNTEDMEIAFRIQSHGYRIANCYNAFVYTITPATFGKLYRQRTRWTYGFLKNLIDYRHIVLNKKYGNIGMLTLPFAILGIIFVFYFAGQFLYHVSTFIKNFVERIATVGWRAPHFLTNDFVHGFSIQNIVNPIGQSLHLLYISTGMTTILALLLFSTTLYIIFKSKKMAEDSMRPSRDIFYYIFFYSFLAPVWIGKAVYNVALSKKTPWR